jgi:acyl-CoA reductase-like NAD-dependent aldehyde dehydrogenase
MRSSTPPPPKQPGGFYADREWGGHSNQRRLRILQKFEDVLKRRREVEAKIVAELGCVEDMVAATLRTVEDAVGEIEVLADLKEE